MFKGINVVSITVRDLSEAIPFYGDILGLGEPVYDLPDAGWVEFSADGSGGNIAIIPAPADWQPSTGTTVVLNVEDCAAAVAELRGRGVSCEDPQTFSGLRHLRQLPRSVRQPPADVQSGARELRTAIA